MSLLNLVVKGLGDSLLFLDSGSLSLLCSHNLGLESLGFVFQLADFFILFLFDLRKPAVLFFFGFHGLRLGCLFLSELGDDNFVALDLVGQLGDLFLEAGDFYKVFLNFFLGSEFLLKVGDFLGALHNSLVVLFVLSFFCFFLFVLLFLGQDLGFFILFGQFFLFLPFFFNVVQLLLEVLLLLADLGHLYFGLFRGLFGCLSFVAGLLDLGVLSLLHLRFSLFELVLRLLLLRELLSNFFSRLLRVKSCLFTFFLGKACFFNFSILGFFHFFFSFFDILLLLQNLSQFLTCLFSFFLSQFFDIFSFFFGIVHGFSCSLLLFHYQSSFFSLLLGSLSFVFGLLSFSSS